MLVEAFPWDRSWFQNQQIAKQLGRNMSTDEFVHDGGSMGKSNQLQVVLYSRVS